MRQRVSSSTGRPSSTLRSPPLPTCTSFPCRATVTRKPGSWPESTHWDRRRSSRSRREASKPTSAGSVLTVRLLLTCAPSRNAVRRRTAPWTRIFTHDAVGAITRVRRPPDGGGESAGRAGRSDRDGAGGLLQVRAGGHLDGVGGGDVDRLTGLRVAAGARGALGALDGQEARDGDLVAAGDRVDELLLEAGEDRVDGRGRDVGALGDGGDQFGLVHEVPLVSAVAGARGSAPSRLHLPGRGAPGIRARGADDSGVSGRFSEAGPRAPCHVRLTSDQWGVISAPADDPPAPPDTGAGTASRLAWGHVTAARNGPRRQRAVPGRQRLRLDGG